MKTKHGEEPKCVDVFFLFMNPPHGIQIFYYECTTRKLTILARGVLFDLDMFIFSCYACSSSFLFFIILFSISFIPASL